MGYTITVGELEVCAYMEAGLDDPGISFDAVHVRHDNAPAFGDPTDYTNARRPSYTAWSSMLRDVGLTNVFFCDGNLIGDHPGVRLVTTELCQTVCDALVAYRVKHPGCKPEYGTDIGGNLCRLIWLDYWLRWALANCKVPVIANS